MDINANRKRIVFQFLFSVYYERHTRMQYRKLVYREHCTWKLLISSTGSTGKQVLCLLKSVCVCFLKVCKKSNLNQTRQGNQPAQARSVELLCVG